MVFGHDFGDRAESVDLIVTEGLRIGDQCLQAGR